MLMMKSLRSFQLHLLVVALLLPGLPSFADPVFTGLGDVGGRSIPCSRACRVSADGSTVVVNGTAGAYRWTLFGGMELLDDLPGGEADSLVFGVSADGSTIVGSSSSTESSVWGEREAARWTSGGGVMGLGALPGGEFSSEARGVSADGSIIVGGSSSINNTIGREAFLWTSAGGMVGLGDLPGAAPLPGGEFYSIANGISADGSIVVGFGTSASGIEAFRWTSDGGMVGLGHLPRDFPHGILASYAEDISADGSVVVGRSITQYGPEAFRWTSDGGMVSLSDFSGGISFRNAVGVSSDGSMIVGAGGSASGSGAIVWDATNGTRELEVVLTGLGVDFAGWELTLAADISDDGRVIIGSGTNPSGGYESWIVILDEPLVPEPPAPLEEFFFAGFSGPDSIWDVSSQDYGSTASECELDRKLGLVCIDVTTTTPVVVDAKGRISGTASIAVSATVDGELVFEGSVAGPLKGKLKGRHGTTNFGMKFRGRGMAEPYGVLAGPSRSFGASSATYATVDSSGNCTSNTSVKVCIAGMGCRKLQTEPVQTNLGDGSWTLLLDLDDQGMLAGTATARTAMRNIDYWIDGRMGEGRLKLTPVDGEGGKIWIKGLLPTMELGETAAAEIRYKIDGYQGKVLKPFGLGVRAEVVTLWPNTYPSPYPRVVGVDPVTGIILIEIYFCSDVCPEYGGTYIVFAGIRSEEECAEVGGVDFIDPAWGGYIGCGPNPE